MSSKSISASVLFSRTAPLATEGPYSIETRLLRAEAM